MLRVRGKAVLVYGTLGRFGADLEKDWLFRLSLSTLAMTAPFFVTLALAINDRRRQTAFAFRESRLDHRGSVAGFCLETCERQHHPLEAVPKYGDARRGRAALRHSGHSREVTRF